MFFIHLFVDGVQRFFPTGDTHGHAGCFERRFHFALDFLKQVTPTPARLGNGFGQRGMAPGEEVAKGQVLKFLVSLVQTEAVGNGCINVERLRRDAGPFVTWGIGQGAHIVGAVGQLDQDDANIARHGQQHLAKRLSLVFFTGREVQLFQLGQAVDQLCDGGAKAFNQLGFGYAAVF